MKIKLVVDSASDINKEEAEKLGVELVSMGITFGEETFLDGVSFSHRQFFEKLIESSDFPKTSQVNEFTFNEVFERLVDDGYEVLCITISSKLSGTYNSARLASEKYKGKVRVVDSLNVCIGERILIQYALKMLKNSKSLDEIEKELNEIKSKIKVLALLNTLKYLQKGGRISAIKAFAGELLNLKPVIAVVNGEIKLVGKAMGSKKGNNLLMQLVDTNGGIDFDLPYAVAYSGLGDELLKKYLTDSEVLWKEKTDNVPSYMIGSTIGTHVGPGAIAVSFFSNN